MQAAAERCVTGDTPETALPPAAPTLLAASSRQRVLWALLVIATLWLAVVWALAGERG